MRRSATHRRANGRFRRWLFGLAGLLGLALALSACSDDVEALADGTADEAGTPVAIAVHLRVQRPGAQTRANSSGYAADDPLAPVGDEYTLGYTEEEMAVHSLTLVMMRVRTDGTEEFERSQTIQSPTDTDNDGDYDATFELTGYSGTKRFYLLANAEPAHIGAFTTEGRVFDAGMEEKGHNIVGKLMNVDSDTGAGSHILMTAAITTADGGRDIPLAGPTVEEGQGRIDIEIDNPVRLTRAVAKVLLTCHTTGDYVNSDEGGWIRLKNVRYILNVLNRKTYMDYRTDADGNLLDPNYKMSDWIAKRVEDLGGYGLRDLEAYRREFLYYDTQGMVNLLNTAVQKHEEITVHPCTGRQATRYDASNLGNNDANHYTEGLYCPENMVHWDLQEMTNAEFLSANRFVTTRVMVGAKYTPKKIWIVDANGDLKEETTANEDEAHDLLNAGLPDGSGGTNAGENPGYDDNYLPDTFWRCDESGNAYDGQYFTYEAMMKVIADPKETVDFNRYDGGWGYYYTYIDKEANAAANAAEQGGQDAIASIPHERWGVKRNHYYILNVEKIEGPGSAYPGNEMMRIHSRLLDWVDKGGSDVEVDIPQELEEGTL